MMGDFLRIDDLPPAELTAVVEEAARIKADPRSVAGRLEGARVGLFFMKPSTRTRVSAEVATRQLGGWPVVLRNEEVGLGTREAPQDVARVLSRYLDLIAVRVFDHTDLEVLARHAEAPVVNLLSDLEHPCQILADLQTIAEAMPLEEAVVAYLGDGNNVCHSLMAAGSKLGMEVRVATPPGYEPRAAYRELPGVSLGNDPEAAVKGARVVYTDVWASMGQEAEAEERRRHFGPYRVDLELFGRADPGAIFLHCLPAHRGEEVTEEVLEHERSRVFDQAENRLHSFKSLLLHLLG